MDSLFFFGGGERNFCGLPRVGEVVRVFFGERDFCGLPRVGDGARVFGVREILSDAQHRLGGVFLVVSDLVSYPA